MLDSSLRSWKKPAGMASSSSRRCTARLYCWTQARAPFSRPPVREASLASFAVWRSKRRMRRTSSAFFSSWFMVSLLELGGEGAAQPLAALAQPPLGSRNREGEEGGDLGDRPFLVVAQPQRQPVFGRQLRQRGADGGPLAAAPELLL